MQKQRNKEIQKLIIQNSKIRNQKIRRNTGIPGTKWEPLTPEFQDMRKVQFNKHCRTGCQYIEIHSASESTKIANSPRVLARKKSS